MKCSVETCTRLAVVKGLCDAHYNRKQRTGSVKEDIPLGAYYSRKESVKESEIFPERFKPKRVQRKNKL